MQIITQQVSLYSIISFLCVCVEGGCQVIQQVFQPYPPLCNMCIADGDWNTEWVCANGSDAYVDGGMIFNVTDKKLYVPVCGYYHITSQMYFYVTETAISPEDRLKYVSLEVFVNKNCDSGDNFVLLRSYASLVLTPSNNKDIGKTTVHIGDVVKMCGGGTIYDDHYSPFYSQ